MGKNQNIWETFPNLKNVAESIQKNYHHKLVAGLVGIMHKHCSVFKPNLKTATIWRREQLRSYREIRASSKRSHRASRGGVNLSCRSRTVTRSSLRYAAADKKWSKFSHCRNWGPVFCAQIPPGSTNQESGSHVLIVRGGIAEGGGHRVRRTKERSDGEDD